MLLSWHNLAYYQDLMSGLRAAIAEGVLAAYAQTVFAAYAEPAENVADA